MHIILASLKQQETYSARMILEQPLGHIIFKECLNIEQDLLQINVGIEEYKKINLKNKKHKNKLIAEKD